MGRKQSDWRDGQPIYRQIADILIARLIEGDYAEGGLLPSVRHVAEEFSVSPLTAAKVLQELDKEDISIKRRGIGSEVRQGARKKILKIEREQFLKNEWPEIQQKLDRLGLDIRELFEN